MKDYVRVDFWMTAGGIDKAFERVQASKMVFWIRPLALIPREPHALLSKRGFLYVSLCNKTNFWCNLEHPA